MNNLKEIFSNVVQYLKSPLIPAYHSPRHLILEIIASESAGRNRPVAARTILDILASDERDDFSEYTHPKNGSVALSMLSHLTGRGHLLKGTIEDGGKKKLAYGLTLEGRGALRETRNIPLRSLMEATFEEMNSRPADAEQISERFGKKTASLGGVSPINYVRSGGHAYLAINHVTQKYDIRDEPYTP